MYTCRECEKPINQAAEVCPYCGADLAALQAEAEPASSASVARRMLVWGTMIAAVWAFLWFILPERSRNVAGQAEAHGLHAVETTRDALRAHLETHGSYPATLEGLAPPSFNRVREAARRAQAEGYRLDYAPGPAAGGGNIRTFTVVARSGHHGFRSFFVNESGVIRWTRENRAAAASDQPI
jgi:hypothetical protein